MKKCEICGLEEPLENHEAGDSPKILHLCESCQNDRKFDGLDHV
ncbi:hypothetical protein QUF84_24435 [Fictibacillus enclensis]|nr:MULTISPECIES: hypothetical protein [Fictibacillus]MDM5340348.1 hypothetical protein [Fictibacillus enclensis]WHY71841.1 hypothetical protein QNH15_23080 [Fictibacillus enclensis]SCC38446.1 hypothetical protein GA0061096_4347 [Fictibacillus enclensis]